MLKDACCFFFFYILQWHTWLLALYVLDLQLITPQVLQDQQPHDLR